MILLLEGEGGRRPDEGASVCPAWASMGGGSPLREQTVVPSTQTQGEEAGDGRSNREVGAERSERVSCGPTNRNRIRGVRELGRASRLMRAPTVEGERRR